MHGLFEVYRIQHFDPVTMSDQHSAAFHNDRTFWICNHIRYVIRHLHEVGLHIESCFTGSGSTDDDHIFVSCILRKFRAAVHSQPLRLCQDDIIFKYRINKWFNVFFISPSCRTVFFALPELFCIFPFHVHNTAEK